MYPKAEVDGSFGITTDSRYGSAMWHGVWPGPGQAVTSVHAVGRRTPVSGVRNGRQGV